MRVIKHFCLLSVIVLAAASATLAQTIMIDFESDATGNLPNGWMSVDSAQVSFSDSMGADLQLADWGNQSNGQGLAVFGDDPSFLIMDFTTSMQSITLWFGNDDSCCSNAGDEAVLAVFSGATQIDEVRVVMNRNDNMDQSISFTGAGFDRATFFYDVSTSGLIEVVDDIELEPGEGVPTVPHWVLVVLFGVLGLGSYFSLRRRSSLRS